MQKLTDEEYKQLLMRVAVQISPVIVETHKSDSEETGKQVALYARDISEAVDAILRDNSGNCFR